MNQVTTPGQASREREPRQGFFGLIRDSLAWGDLRHTPYGLRPALIFGASYFLTGLTARFEFIAGPNIVQDLNIDIRVIAGLASIVGILGIAGSLFVGWLADRRNRLLLAGGGRLVQGAANVLQSGAQDIRRFGSGTVGTNLGGELASVPFFSLISDYYPLNARGRMFGLLLAFARTGSTLSVFVIGILVTTIGWRPTLLVLGLPIGLMGIVIVLLLRNPTRGYFEKRAMGLDEETARREDPPPSFGEGWRTIWSVRMVRRIFVSDIFSGIGLTPFALLLPFMLADLYGLNPLQRSLFAIPTVIMGLFGGILGGGLIDVLGRRSPSSVLRTVGALAGIPAFGILVLAAEPPLVLASVGYVIIVFGTTVIQPAFLSMYSQVI
ncbi:MAG: MFS transporter, partial [Actinomycetota bacterium]